MTSNLGFSNNKKGVGFNEIKQNKEELDNLVKKFFKEEFLNRVDEVFYFESLNEDGYRRIASCYVDDLMKNCLYEFDKDKFLEDFDYTVKGVRELKRKLKKEIIKDCMEIV